MERSFELEQKLAAWRLATHANLDQSLDRICAALDSGRMTVYWSDDGVPEFVASEGGGEKDAAAWWTELSDTISASRRQDIVDVERDGLEDI